MRKCPHSSRHVLCVYSNIAGRAFDWVSANWMCRGGGSLLPFSLAPNHFSPFLFLPSSDASLIFIWWQCSFHPACLVCLVCFPLLSFQFFLPFSYSPLSNYSLQVSNYRCQIDFHCISNKWKPTFQKQTWQFPSLIIHGRIGRKQLFLN